MNCSLVFPQHLADLRRSGLSDEQICRCGFRSSFDSDELRHLLRWKRPAKALGPCLLIPFHGPDGEPLEYVRVKPDNPRAEKADGKKLVRYESPAGAANRAYLPPVTRAALADPAVPLVVTEGEKKSAKADQEGFPCVGLVGVYGWQAKRPAGADGRKRGPRELITDLTAVVWRGRLVYLVFDSDAADKPQVRLAERHLAEALTRAGAVVRVVRLPPAADGSKQGVDDYLVSAGPAAFAGLLAATAPTRARSVEAAGPTPGEQGDDGPDNPHRLAAGFLAARSPGGPPLRLRYWRGEFVRYAGGAFRPVPDDDLRAGLTKWVRGEFLRQHAADRAAVEPGDRRPAPKVRPVTRALVGNALQAVQSLCLLPADTDPPAWIDGATGPDPAAVLAVRNGLLDLDAAAAGRAGALLPPSPSFFTPTAAPFAFDPAAPPPRAWLRFLADLWPDDPESVATLQAWFGYLLSADTSHQKILFAVGPRRAGKGTIARVLRELVGPGNVAGPTLGSLSRPFGLQPLLGKSVAVVPDARLGGRADAAAVTEVLLCVSGEDAVTVDRKHRESVTAKLPTRFVLLSNELPRLGDASGALAGRLVVLRLTRTFYGQEDKTLTARLTAELPGILLWAIEGWRRLRDRGRFVQPASGAELVADLEDLSSPVGAFVRERCQVGPGLRVGVGELYREWRSYCEDHGRREPGTEEKFGGDLRAAVPALSKQRPRTTEGRLWFYTGIGLGDGPIPDP